jgi:PAS domain S-box-containing protein
MKFQEYVARTDDKKERQWSEEAFRVLVSQAPMGMFIVQGGKFKLINPSLEKITGYTAVELLGDGSVRLVSSDPWKTVQKNAVRMLKGECDQSYEFPIITKSGETRWVVEKVTSTIYKGKSTVLGYLIDISEHKGLEDQFLQAQKMEALGRLAREVAHEFKNLLMTIMNYSEILKMRLTEDDSLIEYVDTIERAAERAASLTRQFSGR